MLTSCINLFFQFTDIVWLYIKLQSPSAPGPHYFTERNGPERTTAISTARSRTSESEKTFLIQWEIISTVLLV